MHLETSTEFIRNGRLLSIGLLTQPPVLVTSYLPVSDSVNNLVDITIYIST